MSDDSFFFRTEISDPADRRWRDGVKAIDRVPLGMRRPSRVLELALGAPPGARPVLLAEYWHLLMAGIHHDPVYILAVALDVWGDELSNPPELLAETLAAAPSRRMQASPWRLGHLPPRPLDSRGLLETALDALSRIPEDFDFVRGWAQVRLKPLLLEAGLLEETLTLARGLTDRLDARADTLRRLAAQDAPNGVAAPPCDGRQEDVGRLIVPCDFETCQKRFRVYLGRPAPGFHLLHFQAAWVRGERGGTIPAKIMDRLREAAD